MANQQPLHDAFLQRLLLHEQNPHVPVDAKTSRKFRVYADILERHNADLARRYREVANRYSPNQDRLHPEDAGAGFKIPVNLKKDELTSLGYRLNYNIKDRHHALDRAIKKYGPHSVLKKIVILRTFNKNNRAKYNKLDKDVLYIQDYYF